jgi:hypothetical protein
VPLASSNVRFLNYYGGKRGVGVTPLVLLPEGGGSVQVLDPMEMLVLIKQGTTAAGGVRGADMDRR